MRFLWPLLCKTKKIACESLHADSAGENNKVQIIRLIVILYFFFFYFQEKRERWNGDIIGNIHDKISSGRL